ncbi:hypothetical protein CORC01_06316 [Colletotrichum orchidophilum]|uniref:Uncharacterized protein n=1 Tax=Colletotrichum orchidophilum TaxID=1209926 RepID=A0A1G4BA83_9PEZI|nr:uncharacterized protein CORC01_06316 [Colletotrichum orchidophilum]OHE98320.1 hypothetical protein CORC01_06316 [Colletotrichum orchidophilum]
MKFTSTLVILASAGAVAASIPNAGVPLIERDEIVGKIGLGATKTNPRERRADGSFNLVARQTHTKGDRMDLGDTSNISDEKRAEEAVQEKRDETPTKTNPRVKRADGTWNLVPRETITGKAKM